MSAGLRVLPLRPFYPQDLAYLRARLDARVELLEPASYADVDLAAAAEGADALLGGAVSGGVLARASKLKLLQVPWTGVDTLDFPLLKKHGVTVCNSHSNADAVAEYALALLLAAVKSIPLHDASLRQGEWLRPRRDGGGFTPPRLLAGGTIGFIGYGAVARATARLLAAFGARMVGVASHARTPAPVPLADLRGPESLHAMLAECDAVIVSAPLTPRTRGMLGAAELACLKPGSSLVLVSRAELVDEAALYDALKSGRLGSVAIDVWRDQPAAGETGFPSKSLPFHELPNAVLSPHRAGFAAGQLPHLGDAAENLNRLVDGRPLINRVDLDAGY